MFLRRYGFLFFLWSILSNGLPMLQNLIKSKLNVEPICLMCLEHTESIIHVFSACPFTLLIWANSGLPAHVLLVAVSDMWDWVVLLKQVLSDQKLAHFVCLPWCIWHHRNQIVHDGKHGDPLELQ